MNKFYAALQLLLAAFLLVLALATLVNLLLIITRPETISVVNTLIGQGLLIICLLALSRILFRKGMAGIKAANVGQDSAE